MAADAVNTSGNNGLGCQISCHYNKGFFCCYNHGYNEVVFCAVLTEETCQETVKEGGCCYGSWWSWLLRDWQSFASQEKKERR